MPRTRPPSGLESNISWTDAQNSATSRATCELMESRDAAEIGLYNIIGQVVKPALGKALGLPGDLLGSHSQPGGWQAATVAPDEDQLDLARRIYEVLDEWAASVSPPTPRISATGNSGIGSRKSNGMSGK
jgi:hypothetical protein